MEGFILVLFGLIPFTLGFHEYAGSGKARSVETFVNCSTSPQLEIYTDNGEVFWEDISQKFNSSGQRIYYFPKPIQAAMECTAKFPIEMQVEREMVG
jgi:hypothetical protein